MRRSRAVAEVDEREMAKEEKKELVLTSAKKHRGVVTSV